MRHSTNETRNENYLSQDFLYLVIVIAFIYSAIVIKAIS